MHQLVTFQPSKPLADSLLPARPWSMFLPPPCRVYDPETGRWTWQAARALTISAGRGARRKARKKAMLCGCTVAVVSKRGREFYRHAPVYLMDGMALVVI